MKTNYLNLLGTAFAVVLAAGCSQEELTDNPQYAVGENVLSVNVVTDGFIDSESGSRAITEGVKTTFEKGDRMGIYADSQQCSSDLFRRRNMDNGKPENLLLRECGLHRLLPL